MFHGVFKIFFDQGVRERRKVADASHPGETQARQGPKQTEREGVCLGRFVVLMCLFGGNHPTACSSGQRSWGTLISV